MLLGGIVGGTYGIDGGGGANPVSYYYGKNQTKRAGENYMPSGSGTNRPAEFKATADEVYNGGKSDLLTIKDPSAVSDADITSGTLQCIVQFPAGRYHLLFQGYTEVTQTNFRIQLKQVQSGTDDTVIIHTQGWTNAPTPARTTYQLMWTDFIVDGTEDFYFFFPSAGQSRRSHFLRVEKVA